MIEDTELREMLRATAEKAALPTVMPQPMRRRVALRRARTIGVTFLMTVAIAVGGFGGMRVVTLDEAAPGQTAGQPDGAAQKSQTCDPNIRDMTPVVAVPKLPYTIDLSTRDMRTLPDSIIRVLATGRFDRFAASSDGSSLAFVGEDAHSRPQIFMAGIDGTGLHQVTHDPRRAMSPAWSPDGTKIAYDGYGTGDGPNLFVLDVVTGEAKQITHERPPCPLCAALGAQFTPDGSALIYTGGPASSPVVRTVPVAGGREHAPDRPGQGPTDAGNAAMSPDGSLVTFLAGGNPESNEVEHCGPCRFVANADGTNKRIITGWVANPAGAWSPDGTRIVLADDTDAVAPSIRVVDVVTGEAATVAEGRLAIWLDDHTLLVDV